MTSVLEFLNFFKEKVTNIRASTTNTPPPIIPRISPGSQRDNGCYIDNSRRGHTFNNDGTKQTLFLDPIPTWLVKDCCTDLAPFLTMLFNKYIASSDVLLTFKKAFITPLFKKQNLNVDELSNYRPVSNLSSISKQLEKVIASRMVSYLTTTIFSLKTSLHTDASTLLQRPCYCALYPILCQPSSLPE